MKDPVSPANLPASISALLPRGTGHNFVIYGDSCSGVPGAPHERSFAAVNAVVRRLDPEPDFIIFPGDEITGLTADEDELRSQWRHWRETEMAWLDRARVPVWHTTGNHTTYDEMSEAVFREVLDLPQNGPDEQKGLSYFVRRDDLLLVFVHTSWSGMGGEGYVETDWLRQVLTEQADARHKLVVGHHPVFPINGFSGACQREVAPEVAGRFWDVLVDKGVLAYLCSHILAFDVQVHRGVLQLCTAGAGTLHRMPEGIEYLHCVQAALDQHGFRYQVLDLDGRVREQLFWPAELPAGEKWSVVRKNSGLPLAADVNLVLRFQGTAAADCTGAMQTLICAGAPDELPTLWVGLRGAEQRLTVIVRPEAGRSPHYWRGPVLAPGKRFSIELMLHRGMGPGGIACRFDGGEWSSLEAASPWGLERIDWPEIWTVGGLAGGDQPFIGSGLVVKAAGF